MLSPLPFFGPVGAVRIGLHRRRTRRQPDVAAELGRDRARPDRRRHEGRPHHGRGRRRRGPRGRCSSRRSSSRTARSAKLCEAQEDLRGQAGKAKWLDHGPLDGDRVANGHAIWERIQSDGLVAAGAIVDELLSELAPEITMDSTDDDIQRQIQVKTSLSMLLEKQRLAAVEGPVREQFENDLQRPHRRRAGLEGAQVREAASALRPKSSSNVQLPFPVGAERAGEGLAHEVVCQEGRRGDLQGHRPQEDRGRQAAARRSRHRRDPADRGRGRHEPARPRLRPLHARPDAGALVAHARHRQGGSAHRRPLPRARSPLHAPLQLPALLGRGDGLHARPEAARHRPRCARTARARGDDPDGRRVPVHDPHRLRDARVERLVVDGARSAARPSR